MGLESAIKWRSRVPPGSDSGLVLARRLRDIVERAAAEDPSIRNNGDFAARAGVGRSVFSAAVGGLKRPTEATVRAVLATAGIHGGEEREILALLGEPQARHQDTTWLVKRFGLWDVPAPGSTDYHDWRRLLETRHLNEATSLNEARLLDPLPGEVWAYIVCSALQNGTDYRRWYDEAMRLEHHVPVVEALVERLVGGQRRPSWRAAWLLQSAPLRFRAAAIKLARDLRGAALNDKDQIFFNGWMEAILTAEVENYLTDSSPELISLDVCLALLSEFQQQVQHPVARGKLEAYLDSDEFR